MDEHLELDERKDGYKPRPKWQIAIAWVLLVLVIIGVAGWYYWIAFPFGT